jgi:hypothetical protein|tara:strand:- start:213 stop:407 length:195 start_codon:yes stop_codon:yes gene_type:complete
MSKEKKMTKQNVTNQLIELFKNELNEELGNLNDAELQTVSENTTEIGYGSVSDKVISLVNELKS